MTRTDEIGPLAVMMRYNIKLPEYTYLQDLLKRAKKSPALAVEAVEILMNFKTMTAERALECVRAIQANPIKRVEK